MFEKKRTNSPATQIGGILLLLALLAFGLFQPTSANTGVNWLANQANLDGSYSTVNDIAVSFQTTAETLRTFYQLGETEATQPSMTGALDFINAVSFSATEYLSRTLITNIIANSSPSSTDLSVLLTHINDNGGVGDLVNYNSTIIDTAWALEALAMTDITLTSINTLYPAIDFLLNQQDQNGGWAHENNDTSVIVTAIVMRALWHYRHHVSNIPTLNVVPALDKAQDYLLAQRESNALWAETFESALALIAILPRLPDHDGISNTLTALRAAQLDNGSWDNDVYSTALVLRTLHLADSPQPNPDLGQIFGTVIDGQTGLALSGMTVQLSGTATNSQTTNTAGEFSFTELQAGNYTIQVGTDGGLTAETTLLVGQSVNLGNIRVFREENITAIQGTITDAKTGQALEGVIIEVTGSNEQIFTDGQGAFLVSNLNPGEIIIQARKEGYLAVSGTSTLAAGQTLIFSPTLSPAIVTLQGTVTDRLTDLPLAEVQIFVNDTQVALTEADGSYFVEEVKSSLLELRAEKEGYDPITGTATVTTSNATMTFSPQLSLSGTTPPPQDNAGIMGTVVDKQSQLLLAGVTVLIGENSVITDETGQFSLTNLAAGDSQLELNLTGYTPETLAVSLSAFTTVNVGTIWLAPVDYQEPAGLRGIVISASTNQPLSQVQVTANFGDTPLTITSQTDGTFEFDPLTDLEGEVSLTADGYAPFSLRISLVAGEILDLGQIRLKPAESVALLPDLVAEPIDVSTLQTDLQTLAVSGVITVPVTNAGTIPTSQAITLLAFYDANLSENYEANMDVLLGESILEQTLAMDTTVPVNITVSGQLPFRDAPIKVWVDSVQTIVESDEINNIGFPATDCSAQSASTVDLVLCLDASGSVSYSQFGLQLNGTADAIADPNIMPHDGSVRLTVLQFSSYSRVEIPPTFIDNTNASEIAETIRNIYKLGGGTSIHSCIDMATDEIMAAEPITDFQVMTVSTDGYSSLYYAQQASQSAQEAGIDALNGIAVGSGADFNLLESIVFPQPPGGDRGYVVGFSNYEEYVAAIANYIQIDTRITDYDLTTARLHLIKNPTDDTVSLQVRVGNGGIASWPNNVSVTFLEGEPSTGGLVLGTVQLEQLTGPEHQYQDIQLDGVSSLSGPVELYAVVDLDEHITECNDTNNSVHVTLKDIAGQISVTTDALEYGPNTPVVINYTVLNQGVFPIELTETADFTVELRIIDMNGDTVTIFPAQTLDSLAGGDSQTLQVDWNTGTVLVGNYEVQALLRNAESELVDQANTTFEIIHGTEANIGIRTTTDKPIYHTTDTVQIDNLVRNLTENTLISGAKLRLTVLDPVNQSVFNQEIDLEELAGNAKQELLIPYTFQQAAEGIYTIQSEVLDPDDNVLTTDTAQYQVQENLKHSLQGQVTVSVPNLEQGQIQVCTDTLTNNGTLSLTAQPVRQLLVAVENEQEIMSSQVTLDLEIDANQVLERTIDTSQLEVGSHACVLQAEIEGQWETLGYVVFHVDEPPIQIDFSLTKGERGRILILLDEGRPNDKDTHGPKTAPSLSAQRAFLENLLDTHGWSYTIVTHQKAFTQELRSGGYVAYALFSEQQKLQEQVQKELREAVYRGEGLVIAGAHDKRHHFDEVLGIKYKGKYSKANALIVTDDSQTEPVTIPFGFSNHVLRVELRGALSIGTFQLGHNARCLSDDDDDDEKNHGRKDKDDDDDDDRPHHCKKGSQLAMAFHEYGQGKSIYAGFDLLAQATATGENSAFANILIMALTSVHPDPWYHTIGSVIPLQLTLTNQGNAVSGQAFIYLPEDTTLIAPDNLEVDELELALIWPFELQEDQTRQLEFWLRLPWVENNVSIDTLIQVQVGTAPNYQDYDNFNFALEVQAHPCLPEALALLTALKDQDKYYAKALKYAQKAADLVQQRKDHKALTQLIKAIDSLRKSQGADAHTLRVMLGNAIRNVAGVVFITQ